jgi:hypothetical protein
VLWGFYHGVLLVATRAKSIAAPGVRPASSWQAIPQMAGMFVLTMIGWLLFRETELPALVRDLRLSPFGVTDLDRQTGLYLFLLAFLYSVPLWIQSVWVELGREQKREGAAGEPALAPWPRFALQGMGCGLALTAILVLRSRTSLDFIYFQF